MTAKRLNYFSFRSISVFISISLFVVCRPQAGLSQETLNLSGKYKGCNVILIILDALRPDHLSCYGYAKATSPNIDALAKQGILFSNAFSQASYTMPSVTSIFTSVHPYSHRVVHIFKDKVPDKLYTLAQILGVYGYKTVWFGLLKDPHTGSADGVLRGFNEKYQEDLLGDNEIISYWIKKHKKSPFFITIHSYSLHEGEFPFTRFDNKFSRGIPRAFLDSFADIGKKCLSQKRIKNFNALFQTPEQCAKRTESELITQHEFRRLVLSFNKKQLLYFLSLLDSAIYEVDKDMIGGLVKQLKELNLYEKTIIIITADHGNEYKEHGNFSHGPWLYDEVIRVPLVLHLPNLQNPIVIKELVQGIDIFPTALDLLSISIPHQAQGINLTKLIEGKKDAITNEYVISQGIPVGTLVIRSKDWKLIQKPVESQGGTNSVKASLFNLKKDPYELHNVIKDKPKVARALKSRLDAWMKSLVVYPQEESEFVPGLGEEAEERIKKTGYW